MPAPDTNKPGSRLIFLVNGGSDSILGARARALASRIDGDFPVNIAYRHRNKFLAVYLFLKLLRQIKPRLVYVVDMSFSGVVAAAAYHALRGTAWVIDTGDVIYELGRSMGRGWPGLALTWLLEKFSLRTADHIVVRGRNHADLMSQRKIATTWIPDGVNVQQFVPRRSSALRLRLGLDGFLVVGLIGSCIWSKKWQMCYGWDLVELIGLLKDKKVKGVLIGDGSGVNHLRTRCRELGIEDRIVFLGIIPYGELPEYLGAMDVCLSTQTNDLPGNVRTTGKLPLYLAAGKYVLASRVGEAARILPEEMLVDYHGVKDGHYPERLKGRVLRLLEQPADLQCQVSAVELARKYFDYDVLAGRFRELVARMLDEPVEALDPPNNPRPNMSEVSVCGAGDRPSAAAGQGVTNGDDESGADASPRPLRLLAIGHSYVVAMNRAIVREIASQPGFEVTVAGPSLFHGDLRELTFDPEPAGSPLRLVPLATFGSRFIHTFRYDAQALQRLLEEGEFDLVHIWEEPYIYAGFQVARAVRRHSAAKLLFRTAQNLQKRYFPPFNYFERATLRRADGWIAGGQLVFDTRVERGYDPAIGSVLSLGVDMSRFRPLAAAEKTEIRTGLGFSPAGPLIGFVGRLTVAKGMDVLLRAMELLPADLPWSLLFLGSGPKESRILRWARGRGWQQRVRVVLARHDEVPRYLGATDLLVAPSQTTRHWKEQFGRMIVEAFACGVPVMGSDSGEIPHVIGDAGIVVPEADAAAWAREIAGLLKNPQRREELAELGLERARQFSAKVLAGQYAQFYRGIVGGKSAKGDES